jgi:hypothetical protein
MSLLSVSVFKKIARLVLLLIAVLCIYAIVIEWMFLQKKSKTPFTTEYWSHRGNNNEGLPENTIAAFEYALKFGLTGIETDVFWDDVRQTFVVTHDAPQPGVIYPTLNEITGRFKDSVQYWIDFKNLDANNQKKAAAVLYELSEKYKLQNKFFVESSKGVLLSRFHSASIKKLYWLQYNRSFPVRPLKLLYLKSLIVFGSFDGFTCAYGLYDDDFKKQFDGLPLYLFHTPAREMGKEKFTGIKVQLADADYLQQIKK